MRCDVGLIVTGDDAALLLDVRHRLESAVRLIKTPSFDGVLGHLDRAKEISESVLLGWLFVPWGLFAIQTQRFALRLDF